MFFEKNVDKRSRQSMVDFLAKHFRYDTMSSWNNSTSYAHCIKLHCLGLTPEQRSKAQDMLELESGFWDALSPIIDDFTQRHLGRFTIGRNGRSGGYLVLYQSKYEGTGHKSYCSCCGQRNYKSVLTLDLQTAKGRIYAEVLRNEGVWLSATYLDQPALQAEQLTDVEKLAIIGKAKAVAKTTTPHNKCGYCGQFSRENYAREPMQLSTWAGRSMDQGTNYSDKDDWTLQTLRDRVEVVCDFDRTVDEIRRAFIQLLDTQCVVEEIIMVPTKVKRMVACNASV